MLEIFFDDFLIKKKDDKFLYELFLPVSDKNNRIFRPVHATMVSESVFEIKKINDLVEEKKNIQFINIEDVNELNLDEMKEDIKYHLNDLVRCEIKRFFNGLGLVITEKINKTS